MSERRMIEDFIPVEVIGYESTREKVARRRNGHLSTLHLWWARRPLAACRGAIYAALVPPAQGVARERLPAFFEELCRWSGPILPESEALKSARAAIGVASGGRRPKVLDLFAGGGAIPLEALRLGCDAVAVDLNPVAHLIQLCTLKFPQQYGQRLREAVAQWGEWVIARTREEVGDLYSDLPLDADQKGTADLFTGRVGKKALRPIAYLWTRTIPSPARGFEKGVVPLVRQTWLRKKAGGYVALRPIVDRVGLTVRYEVVESKARTEKAAIEEWGFDPEGLSVRGATTCPYSGSPVTAKEVKEAGKTGRLGQQLIAVVCVSPGSRGKVYRGADVVPGAAELDTQVTMRVASLCEQTGLTVPAEPIEKQDRMNFKVPLYGLEKFGDLFTPRQQLLLLTMCKYALAAHERMAKESGDADFAAAVAAYLALLVGRAADRQSVLCRWHNTGEKTENTYARQALPMVWDFSEASPFGGASGDAGMALDLITDVLDHIIAMGAPAAEVIHGRAQRIPLDDDSIDAVITDPPYYDNISYSDLSDFFYVWHKRALGRAFPAIYNTALTPKKVEAVVAPQRHGGDKAKASEFYEDEMRKAFAEAHRVLKPGAPLVCVYAHKTTLGWSTLVDSLRGAGFEVTEAWPLNTEMPDRAGQMNNASLASSIFIVGRKRTALGVGNYASEVYPELVRIVSERVRDLMAVGIGGADLVIASVGAGLAPYTRYDRVELPNGEELLTVRYLDTVQREVLETILAAVFAVDRSGVRQIDTPSRFYVLGRYQHLNAEVEFGELNVLAQGVGVELSGTGSLADGKLRLVAITKSAARLRDFTERGAEPTLGLANDGVPASLVDVLHRLLWLMENDRPKVPEFLRAAQADAGRLRLLANALKGRALADASDTRTEEQKAIDRLLVQWQRVVVEGSGTGELPLFESARRNPT